MSRRGLDHHWAAATRRADRQQSALTLVYIDLDRFKQVNDQHGHSAGDALLRDVSHRLRSVARDSDFVCRIGGDEFLLVAEGTTNTASATAIVVRVRHVLSPARDDRHIAASIGAAIYPDDGDSLDAVLRVADERMYRDKTARRTASPAALNP